MIIRFQVATKVFQSNRSRRALSTGNEINYHREELNLIRKRLDNSYPDLNADRSIEKLTFHENSRTSLHGKKISISKRIGYNIKPNNH